MKLLREVCMEGRRDLRDMGSLRGTVIWVGILTWSSPFWIYSSYTSEEGDLQSPSWPPEARNTPLFVLFLFILPCARGLTQMGGKRATGRQGSWGGDTWGTVLSAPRMHHKLLPTPGVPQHYSQSFPWGRIRAFPWHPAVLWLRGVLHLFSDTAREGSLWISLPSLPCGLSPSHLLLWFGSNLIQKPHKWQRVYQGSW